ncbi:MAG: hypothetical protein ONB48_08795 [candidate division KSB1 bacterium]|nr:hypothetical protein [candidate division KSB1 bacterium]MDZ7275975.1 hypothetical protein [candidate division KSB1 bacterium]MDZ7285743.1 hypothetical protein [candidate division KSB1 bacterium]MDZ7298775.1 hypothetical protein [candidate division KSB1 bacterium]MDZ7305958.1 hypothetical protein [candidate division KSB1 bacterium]
MKLDQHNLSPTPPVAAAGRARRLGLAVALFPFLSIPLIGAQFYFRHDDSALLLWAKEFTAPLHHALSPDPAVNGFDKYPGMGPYWRPFIYLYIKGLWEMFGTTPGPYYVVGGVLFMSAVYFLFRIAEQRWGLAVAVWSCLALLAAFHGTMYNLYHLTIQVSFFYQLALLFFFWDYLQRQRGWSLAGMLLFLVPAMGRQTTPVLMVAILVAEWLGRRGQRLDFLRRNWPALLLLPPAFYLISFSPQTSEGSVLAEGPHLAAIIAFLRERFFYYGGLLTSGVTGILLLTLLGGGVWQHLLQQAGSRFRRDRLAGLWLPLTLIVTFTVMALPPLAIYWLVFCCLYLFVRDEQVRMPIAWAGASLICFLSARYYHNGYLLESGFAFAMALGVLIVRLSQPLAGWWQRQICTSRRRVPLLAGGALVMAVPLAVVLSGRVPALSEPFEVVQIAIDSNQNFQQVMHYLQRELPAGAQLYEFSEEELGLTRFDRRHLPLRERARRVKIMNAEDKLNMLRVLGRDDLQIHAAADWPGAGPNPQAYFLAANAFERELAHQRFTLALVREFKRPTDSAALFRWPADRQDLPAAAPAAELLPPQP